MLIERVRHLQKPIRAAQEPPLHQKKILGFVKITESGMRAYRATAVELQIGYHTLYKPKNKFLSVFICVYLWLIGVSPCSLLAPHCTRRGLAPHCTRRGLTPHCTRRVPVLHYNTKFLRLVSFFSPNEYVKTCYRRRIQCE